MEELYDTRTPEKCSHVHYYSSLLLHVETLSVTEKGYPQWHVVIWQGKRMV